MRFFLGILLCFAALFASANAQARVTVPLGGNSWVTSYSPGRKEAVRTDGWQNWTEPETVFSAYVYLAKAGTLTVAGVFTADGASEIECSIGGVKRKTSLAAGANRETALGSWTIGKPGYVRLDFRGVRRAGAAYAKVRSLVIGGTAVDSATAFVRNNDDNYFYWGRRGPSVHLNYDTARYAGEIEYFYSEIVVPRGNDVVGSYFMANGFAQGYFGIQVNSPTERRVLFSVWSPYQTDDPSKIPADQRVVLLAKGKDVKAGEFGNEGSGGQSFMRYDWKAGETYRFLLRGRPGANNSAEFSAWFYAPAEKEWRLIASFRRPKTNGFLSGLHSFLENFVPETGNVTRRAYYQNQWLRTAGNKWFPVTAASFSHDETARRNFRRDYRGGVESGRFFLENDGFFNESTTYRTILKRSATTAAPVIDIVRLEAQLAAAPKP